MKRKTKEQFIYDSKKKYLQYDYSKVIYINNDTNIILKCNIHNIEFFIKPRSHLSEKTGGCPECSKNSKRVKSKKVQIKPTKEFIKESKEIFGDKFDYSKCKYNGAYEEIVLKCKKHNNTFSVIARNHLKASSGGCKFCKFDNQSKIKSLTLEEVIDKCKKHPMANSFDFNKTKYFGSQKKMKIFCRKHGYFTILPDNFYNKYQNCPKCKPKSKGEMYLMNILNKENIKYDYQKSYSDLVDERKLSYDFYLPEYNLLIEYNGKQHYAFYERYHRTIHGFHKQLHHDWLKRKYAKSNNINLLIINYKIKKEKDIKRVLFEYLEQE